MENFLKTFEVISYIAGVIALIYTIVQFKKEIDVYNENKDKEKRMKAIEIAEEFQKLIANELGFISSVLNCDELNDIIKPINFTSISKFNQQEASYILNKDFNELNEIYNKKLSDSDHIAKCYLSHYTKLIDLNTTNDILSFIVNGWKPKEIEKIKKEIYQGNLTEVEKDKMSEELYNRIQYNKKLFYYKDYLYNICNTQIIDLLNKLEAYCMYFSNGLADEEIVYQSLHQMFLITIKQLYFLISRNNKDNGADKYYVNIIEMYNKWAKRYHDKKKEEIERQENIHMKTPLC